MNINTAASSTGWSVFTPSVLSRTWKTAEEDRLLFWFYHSCVIMLQQSLAAELLAFPVRILQHILGRISLLNLQRASFLAAVVGGIVPNYPKQ